MKGTNHILIRFKVCSIYQNSRLVFYWGQEPGAKAVIGPSGKSISYSAKYI